MVYKSKSDIGKAKIEKDDQLDESLSEFMELIKGTVIDSRVLEGKLELNPRESGCFR